MREMRWKEGEEDTRMNSRRREEGEEEGKGEEAASSPKTSGGLKRPQNTRLFTHTHTHTHTHGAVGKEKEPQKGEEEGGLGSSQTTTHRCRFRSARHKRSHLERSQKAVEGKGKK